MIPFRREPLSWYVDKLERHEPFSSLLYGDGEFRVMAGDHLGRPFTQHREVITPGLVRELNDSLDIQGSDIIHGTDLNLIDYDSYQGQDRAGFVEVGRNVRHVVRADRIEWYDGVVWEDSCREGQLAPLLRVLRKREVVLVSHPKLHPLWWLSHAAKVSVPAHDASSQLGTICAQAARNGPTAVYVVCVGLGAIPLVMRLRRHLPGATFLDLGSVLDVFVGASPERGWRAELYADPARLREVIASNLEGVE